MICETGKIHIMTRLLGGLCLALLSSPASAQEWVSLEQLVVPAEVLPDGCGLARRGGLPFSPRDTNPVITTDSIEIALLSTFVFAALGITKTEEASHGWAAELAAKIEAAYSAMYSDKDHKEIGVWALLFKEPIDLQELQEMQSPRADRPIMRESIVIVVWADSEDRSCYDAIRAFLERV